MNEHIDDVKNRIVERLEKEYSDTVIVFDKGLDAELYCKLINNYETAVDSFICDICPRADTISEYFSVGANVSEYTGEQYIMSLPKKSDYTYTNFDVDAFFKRLDQMLLDVRRIRKNILLQEIEDESRRS